MNKADLYYLEAALFNKEKRPTTEERFNILTKLTELVNAELSQHPTGISVFNLFRRVDFQRLETLTIVSNFHTFNGWAKNGLIYPNP